MSAGKPYRPHGQILPMDPPAPAWLALLETAATALALISLPLSAAMIWAAWP